MDPCVRRRFAGLVRATWLGLQLCYRQSHAASSGIIPVLAMSGIRPELQGFALCLRLNPETVKRINLAISQLKRNGLVQQLRNEALAGPGAIAQRIKPGQDLVQQQAIDEIMPAQALLLVH